MSLYSKLTNNVYINNLLIASGYDAKLQLASKQWRAFTYNAEKSLQENAGFSHQQEVEEALEKVKYKIKATLDASLPEGATVLDFGCGPGIYMQMLEQKYKVTGIDVSPAMIASAKALLPGSTFYQGNFLLTDFKERYDAIYSVSVLEYVPVSNIYAFFEKCAGLLNDNGIIIIQYPHALCRKDLYYPDRNYISYSPALISRVASGYFDVIENSQSYDGRNTCLCDLQPYPTHSKTFKNGYTLVARKK